MLCQITESGSQMEPRLQHDRMPVAHRALDHAMGATHHDTAQHEHGGHHDHSAGGQSDKCNLCSAFCSLTPLASTGHAVLPLLEAADALFPAVSSPALSFLSDGQERPPRSI